jgi:Na+-driven multidrug efflux pump
MGITTYYVIYARMGTDSIAAMNIVSTIDQLALVVLFGLTSATSVIVGNQIGAGHLEKAYLYGGRSLGLGAGIGVVIGILVVILSPAILSLYKVSPEVIELAQKTLIIASCFIWLRSMNAINIVGNLRAGGDTTYSLVLDGLIIWVLGVPMAYFGAFVLELPVYLVYLFVMSEELAKWILGLGRFLSRKWIHNLTVVVN